MADTAQYEVHPMLREELPYIGPQAEDPAVQQVAQEVEEAPHEEVVEQAAPVVAQESDVAKNMRNMREQNERLSRERDEALSIIKELAYSKKDRREEAAPVYEAEPGDLDFLEGKHFKTLKKDLNTLAEKVEKGNAIARQIASETKFRAKHPDVDSVLSDENIAILATNHPEIAKSLYENKDFDSQLKATYTIIKKLGISIDSPAIDHSAKIAANMAKPKPASIIPKQAQSPLNQANSFADPLSLSPDAKKQRYAQMQQNIKNYIPRM